jgi:hypothetical protein
MTYVIMTWRLYYTVCGSHFTGTKPKHEMGSEGGDNGTLWAMGYGLVPPFTLAKEPVSLMRRATPPGKVGVAGSHC